MLLPAPHQWHFPPRLFALFDLIPNGVADIVGLVALMAIIAVVEWTKQALQMVSNLVNGVGHYYALYTLLGVLCFGCDVVSIFGRRDDCFGVGCARGPRKRAPRQEKIIRTHSMVLYYIVEV